MNTPQQSPTVERLTGTMREVAPHHAAYALGMISVLAEPGRDPEQSLERVREVLAAANRVCLERVATVVRAHAGDGAAAGDVADLPPRGTETPDAAPLPDGVDGQPLGGRIVPDGFTAGIFPPAD
ncbi:MAG TPA: hypothetical protein VD903_11910 [Pseudonocardia sp.]|nr:hypothetical protein [Pseudonocardia sp.]